MVKHSSNFAILILYYQHLLYFLGPRTLVKWVNKYMLSEWAAERVDPYSKYYLNACTLCDLSGRVVPATWAWGPCFPAEQDHSTSQKLPPITSFQAHSNPEREAYWSLFGDESSVVCNYHQSQHCGSLPSTSTLSSPGGAQGPPVDRDEKS